LNAPKFFKTIRKFFKLTHSFFSRIIISQFNKTLFTKEVDQENREGYFLVYKRINYIIIAILEVVNLDYIHTKTLTSKIIDGIPYQNYLKNHNKIIRQQIFQRFLHLYCKKNTAVQQLLHI